MTLTEFDISVEEALELGDREGLEELLKRAEMELGAAAPPSPDSGKGEDR